MRVRWERLPHGGKNMKYITLAMVRDRMSDLPSFDCPPDFGIRTFVPGDERNWARIETLAGEFPDDDQALARFQEDYGAALPDLADRCFLLVDAAGMAIGTATAWRGRFAGEERGRVSWVGIVPAYQGRKLAKPLLSAVVQRLAKDEQKAYLTTQTTSFRAINLYLDFGFVPYFTHEASEEGWRLMEETLHRRIL